MDVLASVRQPSTFRMLIWPEASNAQNSIAAVSADGSTVYVLIRRLNSSCRRSIALVVRALRHWLGGSRVKVRLFQLGRVRARACARYGVLYRVPVILTLGRFPKARESDSTWRTKEVRHVGSDI